jgi:hypothetical protein
MASGYPNALDTLSTTHADNVAEVIAAATINDLADAVNKIETELGINPSGSFTTVVARLGAESTVRKTADQANSTVTPASITDLAFPVVIGADHSFEFIIPYSSAATTTGLGLSLTVPALGTGGYISYNVEINKGARPAAGTAMSLTTVYYFGTGFASGHETVSDSVTAINTTYIATIRGVLSNPSAAGNIQVQARSEVAASAITIKKGASGRMILN